MSPYDAEEGLLVEIALPVPLYKRFSYTVPTHLDECAAVGTRVIVPFGRRRLLGIITARGSESSGDYKLRSVEAILDEKPALPPNLVALGLWLADYYMAPPGMALAATLPAALTRAVEPAFRVTLGGSARLRELNAEERALVDAVSAKGRLLLSEIQETPGWHEMAANLIERGIMQIIHPEGKSVGVRRLYKIKAAKPETLYESCKRSPKQRAIIDLLLKEKRALSMREITEWAGCSPSTVQVLHRKGILKSSDQRIRLSLKPHLLPPIEGPLLHTLTADQERAVGSIREAIEAGTFRTFLLQGVTGSGKTEVYLHAIKETVKRGRSALYLVPEIALTLQPTQRLSALFGERVSILHSRLNERERVQEFDRIRSGKVDVVIGPRSALFAPLENPGLIVVDEEQDGAYKQDNLPRYQGRDVAVMRGKMENAVVILGTATPSLVTRHNADAGRYTRLVLPERIGGRPLAQVSVIDNRKEEPEESEHGLVIFSKPLIESLSETFHAGRQALLLVTRKGYAPFLICRFCGHNFPCPACSVTHTVHRKRGILLCHYCNHREPIPETCPVCGAELLETHGIGTEKVAEHFQRHFPDIPFALVERDTMLKRGHLKETLHLFKMKEIDCLIGTQMIAKGHDFPNVTLVGVLTVDQMLNYPDFRNGEHLFTLLTQVAGRSGRGEAGGEVIIQTAYPAHYAVTHAVTQDYDAFYEREIAMRKALRYPPSTVMILLIFSGTTLKRVEKQAGETAVKLQRHPLARRVMIRGPAPSPIARLRGRYRFQILVRGEERSVVRKVVRDALGDSLSSTITVDIDPYSFM